MKLIKYIFIFNSIKYIESFGFLVPKYNFRHIILDINRDISLFIKEPNFNKRRTLLDFPGFKNNTYYEKLDLTFINTPKLLSAHLPNDKTSTFRWMSNSRNEKKDLLFIPGLDMTAIGFHPQTLELRKEFNIHSLVCGLNSTVTFDEFSLYIEKYINSNLKKDLVIVGESFGSLLAIQMVNKLQNRKNIKLVLINPATSYHKSCWPTKFKNNEIGDEKFNISTFMQIIMNGPSVVNVFETLLYLKRKFPEDSEYHTFVYFYMLINLLNISNESILFRIKKWMEYGLSKVDTKYENINVKTILIAGENDDFLPSKEEILYLNTKIKNSVPIVIKNSAHSIPINNCNLYELIQKYF